MPNLISGQTTKKCLFLHDKTSKSTVILAFYASNPSFIALRVGGAAFLPHNRFSQVSLKMVFVRNALWSCSSGMPYDSVRQECRTSYSNAGYAGISACDTSGDAPREWIFPELSNLRIVLFYEHETQVRQSQFTEWIELACLACCHVDEGTQASCLRRIQGCVIDSPPLRGGAGVGYFLL